MPSDSPLSITWKEEVRLWEHREEPVLRCTLSLPAFSGPGETRLNRFFQRTARCWEEYWANQVRPLACADLDDRRSHSRPFTPWEGGVSGSVELHTPTLLSLRMQARERRGDGKRALVCWGDTWTLPRVIPLSPERLFSGRKGWRRQLEHQLREHGERLGRTGECFLDADWLQKYRRFLSPGDFWLSSTQLHIPFPQGSIAPMAEGTPVFSLPLPKEFCRWASLS